MTTPVTLADFLLARISEDEAAAERAIKRNPLGDVAGWHAPRHQVEVSMQTGGAVAIPAPGFLAEAQAKRRIVEMASFSGPAETLRDRLLGPAVDATVRRTVDAVLGLLAMAYADHPDFRDEWRVR